MSDALAAALASLFVGLFSVRYRDYEYWRSWSAASALGGAALCAVYLLAGLAGYLMIDGALASASSGQLAGGVEGLIGHAGLRAQLSRTSPTQPEAGPTLLGLINGWILDALSERTFSGVKRWVRELDDQRLVELTFELFWERLEIEDEPLRARLLELLRSAAHDLEHGSITDRADGRGRLRGFCGKEIRQLQIPRGDFG